MNETPVAPIKETPVLRPANFRDDAYFFFPQNRFYLSGANTQAGIKVHDGTYQYLVLAILEGIVLGAIFYFIPFWSQGGIFAIPVLVVLAFLIPYMFFISSTDTFTERAIREGQIVIGELESCAAVVENETYRIKVVYLFTTPSGKLIRRHTTQTRPDLNGKPLPTSGKPVYVLYFNDHEYYLL